MTAWSAVVLAVLWLTGAVMQGRLRIPAALAIEAATLALLLVALPARAQSAKLPVVVDDPTVQQAVAAARTEFLAGQDFDRLQVTASSKERTGAGSAAASGATSLRTRRAA